MIVKFFSLFTILLFANCANAQKQEKDKEKTKEIQLQKYPDKGFPESTFAIANISLIQMVPDSTRLGYIQKGLSETKVTAIPDKPLTIFFQNYITNKYQDNYNDSGLHFLWVLKNIRINQRSFEQNARAYLYFNANAYISKDGKRYNFATTLDTVLVNGDVNYDFNLHYNNIREALRLLLQKTIDKGSNFTIADTANGFLVPQILSKQHQRFNLPIYTDTAYKEGAYANFNEFINNAPSIINFKTVVVNKKEIAVIVNEKDTVKPWGICQNGELYKYYEHNLIAIEKQGNEFIMSGYVNAINRRNKNVSNTSLFGGLLGVFGSDIVGRVLARKMSEKVITVTSLLYIKKKQPEACTVNMETGEWSF